MQRKCIQALGDGPSPRPNSDNNPSTTISIEIAPQGLPTMSKISQMAVLCELLVSQCNFLSCGFKLLLTAGLLLLASCFCWHSRHLGWSKSNLWPQLGCELISIFFPFENLKSVKIEPEELHDTLRDACIVQFQSVSCQNERPFRRLFH